jgi:hypothetical protein
VFGLNHSDEDAKQVFGEILKRLIRERKLVANESGVITVA